jgi:predicted GIY-YIG superfamily endonuclease
VSSWQSSWGKKSKKISNLKSLASHKDERPKKFLKIGREVKMIFEANFERKRLSIRREYEINKN